MNQNSSVGMTTFGVSIGLEKCQFSKKLQKIACAQYRESSQTQIGEDATGKGRSIADVGEVVTLMELVCVTYEGPSVCFICV